MFTLKCLSIKSIEPFWDSSTGLPVSVHPAFHLVCQEHCGSLPRQATALPSVLNHLHRWYPNHGQIGEIT